MSKIGVGIGEDFPVDDGQHREDAREGGFRDGPRGRHGFRGGPDMDDDAARREAYRAWREQRQEWKRQWRDEWRARRDEWRAHRRELRDSVHGSYYGRDGGRAYWGYGHPFLLSRHLIWRVLAAVVAVAAIVFLFSHIVVILGALLLLGLAAAVFRHGFRPWEMGGYRHDRRPEQSPPPRPTPPPEPPRDSAH